jgi:folylpolyglutamate synthase/dihydropteroate synthase
MVAGELRRRWPGRKAAVLFASATGKRWRQALSALLPVADGFVVTELSGTASEDPAAIAAHLVSCGAVCERVADVESGLRALRRRPGPRLVVGSFYLAGQVRRLAFGSGTP